MNQLKLKLIVAISGILISVVMLGTATYAWFTISTAPEIRSLTISVTATGDEYPFELSLNKETWTTQLDLSEEFKKYDALHPISTGDGQHWYAPTYDSKGNVSGLREVNIEDFANKEKLDDGETNYNYLITVDFYVRTKSKSKSYDFVLSNPEKKGSGLNLSPGETNYGSFVLWDPRLVDGELVTSEAMATVRLGFQRLNETAEGNVAEGSFYIYEPNADMRSTSFATYMTDKGMDEMSYLANLGTQVENYTSTYMPHTVYETKVPKKGAGDSYTLQNVKDTAVVIRQGTSTWNGDRVKQMLKEGKKINSTGIATIGDFLDSGINSRASFAKIEPDKVQKIRLYMWIEGQDVDCWNQIASGSVYANLEFYGREIQASQN